MIDPGLAPRRAARVLGFVVALGALAGSGCHGCGKKKAAPAATAAAPAGAGAPAPTAPTGGATPTPGAPPAAEVVGGTGVATCNQFLDVLARALACEQLAPNRPALQANLDNQRRRFAGWAALAPDARAAAMAEAATQCKGGVDGMEHMMASAGCTP